MTDRNALYAVGPAGGEPRLWVEGAVSFVRMQMIDREVAVRVETPDTTPSPLPATSDL